MARHVDRYPELYQPLYDLLVTYETAESTDPRDKVFALLGLVELEERDFLLRNFPNYSLSMDQVRIITLSHLTQFPNDRQSQPMRPIFRALGIKDAHSADRLLEYAQRIDYLGDTSLVPQIENIMSSPFVHRSDVGLPSTTYQTFESPTHLAATPVDMPLDEYLASPRSGNWARRLKLILHFTFWTVVLLLIRKAFTW